MLTLQPNKRLLSLIITKTKNKEINNFKKKKKPNIFHRKIGFSFMTII